MHRSRTLVSWWRARMYTRVSTLICLWNNNVSRFGRASQERPLREPTRSRVVRNSVDTEISRFQLNLAESNFTGPMCISGLMHSIPAGPGDEVYLHGIILAPSLLFDPYPGLFNPVSNYTCNSRYESSCAGDNHITILSTLLPFLLSYHDHAI